MSFESLENIHEHTELVKTIMRNDKINISIKKKLCGIILEELIGDSNKLADHLRELASKTELT